MILIPASDTEVVLGTKVSDAKANEKPEMKVILDYDFYMGKREVSCGDYAALVKSQGLKKLSGCDNDSLPVVNVNYYDAVLFANAQSKQNKLDTVYSYSAANYDVENHCIFLEGLNFHPEKEGYRLPTEAEWQRAASMDWNEDNCWHAENSGYKVHSVCSRKEDAAGFCDLTGNVMEWVNDWLGNYRDTTVTNYMGNIDGGDIGERVHHLFRN